MPQKRCKMCNGYGRFLREPKCKYEYSILVEDDITWYVCKACNATGRIDISEEEEKRNKLILELGGSLDNYTIW